MSEAVFRDEQEEQDTPARQPWDQALRIVLSGSGLFALFFAFGYLAVKTKLNMLGVWTEVGLDPMGYAATMIQALPVLIVASAVVLILAASAAYVLFGVIKRLGYVFSWSSINKLSAWRSLFILAYSALVLYWPGRLNENQDLLLKQGSIEPSDSALLVVFSEYFRAERFLFVAILFLNTIFLFLLLKRWFNSPRKLHLIHLPLAMLLTAIAFVSLFALPGTYGRLVLPNNYRRATVFLTPDKSDEKQFKGYPLIQAQQALVLFGDEPDVIKGKVVFLAWDAVARLEFSNESEYLLPKQYEHSGLKPLLDKRKEDSMFMKWALALVIGLAFCMVVACAKKQPSNSAQAVTQDEPQQSQTPGPKTTSPTIEPAANAKAAPKIEPPPAPPQPIHRDAAAIEEIARPARPEGFIANFFPSLKKYGDELFAKLDDMVGSSRGDERIDPKVSSLNIWAFDIATGSFEQITRGGGYSSPIASEDGSKISFIKNGRIGIIDISGKNERVVTAEGKYIKILAWNSKTAEYLVVTDDLSVHSLKNGSLRDVSLNHGDSRFFNLPTLGTLSQMSGELKLVYSSEEPKGHWKVFEDHRTYKQAKVLFEGDNIYTTPSWMGTTTILFVSDRKQ